MTQNRSTATEPGEIYPQAGRDFIKPTPAMLFLVLRDDAWRQHCAKRGLASDVSLGRELGFASTTVWRIRTRQAKPGLGFVLQAMRTFGVPFEELFEVLSDAPAGKSVSVAA